MTQRFSIGLFASLVYRALDGFARPIGAALVLAVAVIGLLVTAAAAPLAASLSTVVESTWSQPPTLAPQGPNDRAVRANQDDYLERLVRALDHDF
ncbi:MAG TPA: hypothetical protein VEK55_00865 [Xanthobacteraceae bacterium]|nr:hypothetical protein [Xanthobacteraceae bacterium]